MSANQAHELTTKRQVHAQILVCDGCCCGRTENGHDPVPTDWMKAQWRANKLAMHVDLTTPYCLGPCDVANVVCVVTPTFTRWFGHLQAEHYILLLEWALVSKQAGQAVSLPSPLDALEFQRWRTASETVA